jgi:hypothetical protein
MWISDAISLTSYSYPDNLITLNPEKALALSIS